MSKIYDFEGLLAADHSVRLPDHVARELPQGATLCVRVALASEVEDEDEFWHALSAESFSAAYADEDAVYEELMNDADPR